MGALFRIISCSRNMVDGFSMSLGAGTLRTLAAPRRNNRRD